MDHLTTGEPAWNLTFDEDGTLTSPAADDFLTELGQSGVRDLFVFSHGWNTSEGSAAALYRAVFPQLRAAAAAQPALGPLGFIGVFWPSLWFPDSPSAFVPTSAGAPQAAGGAVRPARSGAEALTGAQIADSLKDGFADPGQRQTVIDLGALIDDAQAHGAGETEQQKRQRLAGFHARLRTLLPPVPQDGFEDFGENALLRSDDPKKAYTATAATFGSTAPGSDVQGIGDWFQTAVNGAKDVLRVFSYNQMKARAGAVGQQGLGPLLAAVHAAAATRDVRVHLIGHSFGARVVSFALAGVGPREASPVGSLCLIQGAFSHWAFAHAKDNPFGGAGALNAVADRVHGPLVATFTPLDWAVGVWYPKASFLAGQALEGKVAGKWDGMGLDGFQAVSPSADLTMPATGGTDYPLTAGTFHRIECSAVINDTGQSVFAGAHSDIKKQPVADLAVAAAAAHA